MVLLLHSGRCYEAEICVILFLLRCPFIWYPFWPKSKFSDFGQKPWTIIRRFYRNRGDFLWSFYSSLRRLFPLRCAIAWYYCLPKSKFADYLAENHGLMLAHLRLKVLHVKALLEHLLYQLDGVSQTVLRQQGVEHLHRLLVPRAVLLRLLL